MPNASGATPPHPERHHFPIFYWLLVDCFLFFCFLPHRMPPFIVPDALVFLFPTTSDATFHCARCHTTSVDCNLSLIVARTPPPHPEQCRREATSSGVMPVSGAFIDSWLIVVLPFFHDTDANTTLVDCFLSFIVAGCHATSSGATQLHPELLFILGCFLFFLV